MHVDHSQTPASSRKDPRGFVVTLSLVIFALTWLAVILTQIKVPGL